jgi:hypothetical protein
MGAGRSVKATLSLSDSQLPEKERIDLPENYLLRISISY